MRMNFVAFDLQRKDQRFSQARIGSNNDDRRKGHDRNQKADQISDL